MEWDPADATLQRRADPLRSVCACPDRSGDPIRPAPGRRLPRLVLLRRRGPGIARRRWLQHRLHLVVCGRWRPDTGQSGAADPERRPLDAARSDRSAADDVAPGANVAGFGHPILDRRLARRADDLAARARDRMLSSSGPRRGYRRGHPGGRNHVHGSAGHPGPVSAARHGGTVAHGSCPQGQPLVVRARWAGGRTGDAGSKRRRPTGRRGRSRLRLGSMACLAIEWRPHASHTVALGVRLLRAVSAGDGALVSATAGRFRQSLAVLDVGPNPAHPDLRADEQRDHGYIAGRLLESGPGPAAAESHSGLRVGGPDLLRHRLPDHTGAVRADRRMGQTPIRRIRTFLLVRRDSVCGVRAGLRRARALRDVPPLCGGARAVHVHPGLRRRRSGLAMGRPTPAELDGGGSRSPLPRGRRGLRRAKCRSLHVPGPAGLECRS